MDVAKCDIELKRHAFLQALKRGIHPDFVEATIRGGKIKRFGKNYVRFIRSYKHFDVVCVGEFMADKIKIITIEKRKK